MIKPPPLRWDEQSAAPQNARKYLPGLVSAYFAAGRELLAQSPQPGELHALRLATKKLRYTLELFRPCYGPGLGARMGALRELQQLLGEINDTVAAERTFKTVWNGKGSAGRKRVESYLRQVGEEKAAAFGKQWRDVFDAPGQEQWWTSYLARQAR